MSVSPIQMLQSFCIGCPFINTHSRCSTSVFLVELDVSTVKWITLCVSIAIATA